LDKVENEWTIDQLYDALEYLDMKAEITAIQTKDLEQQNSNGSDNSTVISMKV